MSEQVNITISHEAKEALRVLLNNVQATRAAAPLLRQLVPEGEPKPKNKLEVDAAIAQSVLQTVSAVLNGGVAGGMVLALGEVETALQAALAPKPNRKQRRAAKAGAR